MDPHPPRHLPPRYSWQIYMTMGHISFVGVQDSEVDVSLRWSVTAGRRGVRAKLLRTKYYFLPDTIKTNTNLLLTAVHHSPWPFHCYYGSNSNIVYLKRSCWLIPSNRVSLFRTRWERTKVNARQKAYL